MRWPCRQLGIYFHSTHSPKVCAIRCALHDGFSCDATAAINRQICRLNSRETSTRAGTFHWPSSTWDGDGRFAEQGE